MKKRILKKRVKNDALLRLWKRHYTDYWTLMDSSEKLEGELNAHIFENYRWLCLNSLYLIEGHYILKYGYNKNVSKLLNTLRRTITEK